jgi:amino acid adenylation domain-containing protein
MLVHQFLENSALRVPGKVALACDGRYHTYSELNQLADTMAAFLMRSGIHRHDRVVILLENRAEAIIALFAVLKAGASFVLLNPGMKENKLAFILNDSGARAIIAASDKGQMVAQALNGNEQVKLTVWVGNEVFPEPVAGRIDVVWAEIVAAGIKPTGRPYIIDIDLATIIYTSGSTGEPKGVVSAHYNVAAAVRSITTYLKNTENDIVLNTLPLSFDYGLYQVLMAFYYGGTLVLEKSFAFPYRIMETLERERVTGFPIVPTMVAILLQMENLTRFDLRHLRYMTNTAAALPVAYIGKLRALFPHVQIFSMYGLTECKRVAYLPPEYLDTKPDSVGIPIPNEEVFVLRPDGKVAAPHEVGELVVRGLNVMRGYWNRPEETAATFRAGSNPGETLLYTGDLFRRDEEGFLYFVGRKDDMIKSRGERISPKEIENALCALDGVVESAVIGVPDEILGQAIRAYIVPDRKNPPSREDILKHCSRNLESFMVPKEIVFRESLPRNASGKIDKKNIA